jgi:hypothetical protein
MMPTEPESIGRFDGNRMPDGEIPLFGMVHHQLSDNSFFACIILGKRRDIALFLRMRCCSRQILVGGHLVISFKKKVTKASEIVWA